MKVPHESVKVGKQPLLHH